MLLIFSSVLQSLYRLVGFVSCHWVFFFHAARFVSDCIVIVSVALFEEQVVLVH